MKNNINNFRVGDIMPVEFVQNKVEGKKPICIVEGIVCFIDRRYRGPFIELHSVWHVEVEQINEKTMVVTPVQLIKSAFENKREVAQRIKNLAETKNKKYEKHKKVKAFYPYKRQQDRENRRTS